MRSDDLAPLLTPSPDKGLGFRQGKVLTFNSQTGENTIDVAGTVLTNVPVMNGSEVIALKPGHVVGLLTVASVAWFILGRILLPTDAQFAPSAAEFASDYDDGDGFALTTTYTSQASSTFTVPAWADEALVHATASLFAQNNSAGYDIAGVDVSIDGVSGKTFYAAADVGARTASAGGFSRLLNVTDRTSFVVFAGVGTELNTWPADLDNQVTLSTSVIFRSTS